MKNTTCCHLPHVIITVVALLAMLASCSLQHKENRSHWILTQSQRDSIAFSATHHYNVGYNFIMEADSMQLHSLPEGVQQNLDYAPDSATLLKNEDFVITEIYRLQGPDTLALDSIWLRIGSDGIPLGWVSETELLTKAAPVDPISHLIFKSKAHWLTILLIISILFAGWIATAWLKRGVGTGAKKGGYEESNVSGYPAAFMLCSATAGLLYSLMQSITPHLWQEYYFHPTLNPLGQPHLLAIYLSFIWLSILLWVANFFDLNSKTTFGRLVSGMIAYTISAAFLYVAMASMPMPFSLAIFAILLSLLIYRVRQGHAKPQA